MSLTRVTDPASPITLEQAKAHLSVLHDDDDEMISALISAASEHLDGPDGWLGRALEEQVWRLATDGFPAEAVALPVVPVVSVDSITVDGTAFTDFASDERCVWPDDLWPEGSGDRGSVVITWTAGTGCPPPIATAMMMLIASWYFGREGRGGMPAGVAAIVSPWRRVTL